MAGTQKRLRRKTRVSEKNYEEVLLLTFRLWMPFLLPPDTRRQLHYQNFTWDWAKNERLLSKRFREAWNEQFHVILHVRTDYLRLLKEYVPSHEIKFYRLDDDGHSILSYILFEGFSSYEYCVVTMPWRAFQLLKPKRIFIERYRWHRIFRGIYHSGARRLRAILFQDVFFQPSSSEFLYPRTDFHQPLGEQRRCFY